MRAVPEVWRQAGHVEAGVVAELALAFGLCLLGLLLCAIVGAAV